MTADTATTISGAYEAVQRHTGRPPAKTRAEDAKLLTLSASTRAVLSRSGVTFIRGTQAFTIAQSEYLKLIRAGEGT